MSCYFAMRDRFETATNTPAALAALLSLLGIWSMLEADGRFSCAVVTRPPFDYPANQHVHSAPAFPGS